MGEVLLDLSPGSVFAGEYAVERLLSRGGMGAVYVATQQSTGRKRALKLMHPTLAADARARERFTREAQIGARIHSDHVVEVVAAGVDEPSNTPWLAMELLDGEDLGKRLQRGVLGRSEAAEIFEQLCHALVAAHAVGVVHRDLKPENVFLARPRSTTSKVQVKVLDFGIAKVTAEAGAQSTAFIGTPAYMAPEQGTGEPITPATDVWALALIVYASLTGTSYWKSMNAATAPAPLLVLQEVGLGPLEPPSVRAGAAGERLPPGFDAWFARAVTRDAKARLADAAEAWRSLAPLLGAAAPPVDEPFADTIAPLRPMATPRAPAARRPFALLWAALALVVVGAGAVAVNRLTATPPPKPKPKQVLDENTVYRAPIGTSPVLGPADALVTIVELGDFECPYTRSSEETLDRIRAAHPTDVRLVWKSYPISLHVNAEPASRFAAEVEAQLGSAGFWDARARLFAAQPDLDRAHLLAIGTELKLDPAKVARALDTELYTPALMADIDLGHAVYPQELPAFLVNGKLVIGPQLLEAAVEAQLTAARALVARGVPRVAVYDEVTRGGIAEVEREKMAFPRFPVDIVPRGGGAGAVEVIEFGDLTGYMNVATTPMLEKLLQGYGPKVRHVWWDFFELDMEQSRYVAAGAHAVDHPSNFWKMHDAVLAAQTPGAPSLSREAMWALAADAGLEMKLYDYQMKGPGEELVRKLIADARAAGIVRPGIYIDGEPYHGWETPLELKQAIDRALTRRAVQR